MPREMHPHGERCHQPLADDGPRPARPRIRSARADELQAAGRSDDADHETSNDDPPPLWRGWTTPDNADAYEHIVSTQGAS